MGQRVIPRNVNDVVLNIANAAGLLCGVVQSWMLSGGCLIIVLVDKRKLDPWLGAGEPGSSGGMGGMSMSMCLPAVLCGMELGYAGHYVLLVGFDAATQVRPC